MGRLKKGKDFVKMAELRQCQYAFVCKRDKTNIYINENFCFILVIFGVVGVLIFPTQDYFGFRKLLNLIHSSLSVKCRSSLGQMY